MRLEHKYRYNWIKETQIKAWVPTCVLYIACFSSILRKKNLGDVPIEMFVDCGWFALSLWIVLFCCLQ